MKVLIAILLIIFLSGTFIHFLRMCKIVKYYQKENEELSKMLNESGEKQIPKKPEWIVVNVDYGAGYYECPCCNRRVKESDDFCSKCGQHLDFDKT